MGSRPIIYTQGCTVKHISTRRKLGKNMEEIGVCSELTRQFRTLPFKEIMAKTKPVCSGCKRGIEKTLGSLQNLGE